MGVGTANLKGRTTNLGGREDQPEERAFELKCEWEGDSYCGYLEKEPSR